MRLARIEVLPQGIGVEGLACKHNAKFQTTDHVWHTSDFTVLAGQKLEAQKENLGTLYVYSLEHSLLGNIVFE